MLRVRNRFCAVIKTADLPGLRAVMLAFALVLSAAPMAQADPPQMMAPQEAHEAATSGDLILLDIRTPDEWVETGVPASGHAVSMHVPGFLEKLAELNGGDRNKPVALICARGNRSAFLKGELEKRGFTQIIDVREGMVGGQNGPGWIERGLPLATVRPASE